MLWPGDKYLHRYLLTTQAGNQPELPCYLYFQCSSACCLRSHPRSLVGNGDARCSNGRDTAAGIVSPASSLRFVLGSLLRSLAKGCPIAARKSDPSKQHPVQEGLRSASASPIAAAHGLPRCSPNSKPPCAEAASHPLGSRLDLACSPTSLSSAKTPQSSRIYLLHSPHFGRRATNLDAALGRNSLDQHVGSPAAAT